MKENKRVVIIISIVILTIINVFLVFKKDSSILEKNKVSKIERKEFNIYLQKTVGSKDYDPSTDTAFPASGYLLNTTKTVCKGYSDQEITPIPVTQELTDGVINGSITINSKNTIYCDLYFDKNETPTINTFNVTGKTSGGTTLSNNFTYQTDNIPFTVTYTDNESDVKQYCINETNSIENCNWQTLSETNSYSLKDNSDGEKTMYIYLKDKANNVSVTTDKSTAKIIVDQTKPKITSFTLTGAADEGQQLSSSTEYTHKVGITYNATITESNIESYCVYEDNCNYQITTSTSFSKVSYTLTNTEGSHTVNIRVKDKAGNESDVSTKSIKLDLNNPSVSKVTYKSKDTSSITVTVEGSDTTDGSGIVKYECSAKEKGVWFTQVGDTCTVTGLTDGTEYTIEGRVTDASGRISTNSVSTKQTTTPAYKCASGETLIGTECVAYASDKGWKRNVTYYKCSVNSSNEYSTRGAAESACTSSVQRACSSYDVWENCTCSVGTFNKGLGACAFNGVYSVMSSEEGWTDSECSEFINWYAPDWYKFSSKRKVIECEGDDMTISTPVFQCPDGSWSTDEMDPRDSWFVQALGNAKEGTGKCYFRGDNCSSSTKYKCPVGRDGYSSKSSCEKSCYENGSTGTVSSGSRTEYYCESGWSYYSGSASSADYRCSKAATRD